MLKNMAFFTEKNEKTHKNLKIASKLPQNLKIVKHKVHSVSSLNFETIFRIQVSKYFRVMRKK